MALDRTARIVAVTALVELGTAIGLLVAPALVVTMLLGKAPDATGQALARALGVALLALAAAMRPTPGATSLPTPVVQAALTYNVLMPLFLAAVGIVWHLGAPGLWAVVALHGVLAVLMLTAKQREPHRASG
jgi:hypothetical protein